jgi:hypothetical protein
MGVMICVIFWQLDDSPTGIADKGGAMFFISINQVMMSMFSVLLTFSAEREVFLREYSNRTYGIIAYYTSKSIVEIPF